MKEMRKDISIIAADNAEKVRLIYSDAENVRPLPPRSAMNDATYRVYLFDECDMLVCGFRFPADLFAANLPAVAAFFPCDTINLDILSKEAAREAIDRVDPEEPHDGLYSMYVLGRNRVIMDSALLAEGANRMREEFAPYLMDYCPLRDGCLDIFGEAALRNDPCASDTRKSSDKYPCR